VREVNAQAKDITELNKKIRIVQISKGEPNDLLDKRDVALKKLGALVDISMYKDKVGDYNIDIKGIGPLICGGEAEMLSVERTGADTEGKPEGAFDIRTTGNAHGVITHHIKGGRLGALLEARDKTVSTILDRLDDMAYTMTEEVNNIHMQGITAGGARGVFYFTPIDQKERAAEFIALSDDILSNTNNIATALEADSPGDNRVAIAISGLQNQKIMNDGFATLDEWYNSIVSDVGVAASRNRFALNQQKDIMTQLNKLRDQVSGVSIDEETTNLLQFQHAFDASAKVIQVADDMLKTVLSLKRD
jgi:flagellar hook-associated protein 1 FlgK